MVMKRYSTFSRTGTSPPDTICHMQDTPFNEGKSYPSASMVGSSQDEYHEFDKVIKQDVREQSRLEKVLLWPKYRDQNKNENALPNNSSNSYFSVSLYLS